MLDLGSLKLGIKLDGAEEVKGDLNGLKEVVGGTASDIKDKLVSGVKTAAAGFAALATAAVAVAESTREYRTEQAKLQTAFDEAGFSAETAKETFSELNGILGDSGQATEAANHLAKLCDTEEDLAEWTDICTGVYGTFGDSLPIEGLTEAANETAKTGDLTGVLADALNWAGIAEDDFQEKLDKCSTEQERQKLITETLSNTYDSAADSYRETAAEVIAANEANQKLTDAMAFLGQTVEPVISTVKSFAADGIEKLTTIIKDNQESIDTFVEAIADFGNFILDNADTIISLLVGIGVGLAVFKVASVISAVTAAMQGLSAAEVILAAKQAILNAVMNANPFVLVISLIAGLVAAVVTLWNTNEGFRNSVTKVWNSIRDTVGGAINKCVSIVTGIGPKMYSAGRDMFNSLWNGIKSIWTSITSWIEGKIDWVKDKFSGISSIVGKITGSHRTGLNEVPYDGYVAELHKGEMVLTAAEAKRYKKGQSTSGTVNNVTVNNYSPKALNEAESARQFRKAQRELALGF